MLKQVEDVKIRLCWPDDGVRRRTTARTSRTASRWLVEGHERNEADYRRQAKSASCWTRADDQADPRNRARRLRRSSSTTASRACLGHFQLGHDDPGIAHLTANAGISADRDGDGTGIPRSKASKTTFPHDGLREHATGVRSAGTFAVKTAGHEEDCDRR